MHGKLVAHANGLSFVRHKSTAQQPRHRCLATESRLIALQIVVPILQAQALGVALHKQRNVGVVVVLVL